MELELEPAKKTSELVKKQTGSGTLPLAEAYRSKRDRTAPLSSKFKRRFFNTRATKEWKASVTEQVKGSTFR